MTVISKFTRDASMIIIDQTALTHQNICDTLGIFGEYRTAVSAKNNIGGSSNDECNIHFLGRFLNSAARTQLAICNDDESLLPINTELLAQLYAGKIHIIDIAAGHGAGVISILNSVCHKRKINELPTDLLDVHIHAIDYSPGSLDIYKQVLNALRENFGSVGIKVEFDSYNTDLINDQSLSKTISCIKQRIGDDPRFLLVCSAISGIQRAAFEKNFSGSYKCITESFSDRNSSFFWAEPFTKKHWIKEVFAKILAAIFGNGLNDTVNRNKTMRDVQIRFHWRDPHINEVISTGAEFYMVELSA